MEDYYQADRKGGDDRTRKKKSSSSDRERTAPRDEAGADNISPIRASRRVPPPDAYGAGGGYGVRPTMDMGVGEQQPSYTRRSSRDVRDDSLAREAAISGVADPKDGRDELSRTGRKFVSSKRAPEVPSLSSGSGSRAAPAPEPYARPLSARHRTTVDLAPQRSIPPEQQQAGLGTAGGGGSSSSSSQAYMSQQAAMMNAAMDAEAAAKADAQRDRERERRLQEKREKRRMLMEKEALELARSRPDEGQATSPSVPLQPPAPAPAPMAADPPPVRKPPPPFSKPVKPAKKAHEEEEGGGYDDDFETYSGDEFEAAEDEEEDHGSKKKKGGSKEAAEAKSEPAPSSSRERKAGSKATSSSSSAAATAPAARKGTFKSCWSSAAGGTRPLPPAGEANGGGVSHKLASALHPRAQRVKQIQSLVPFEVERFVDLNLQPVSMFDIYQRRIRATSTAASSSKGGGVVDGIHQAGTQTQDDDRSVEVQTEELTVAHQSMQFYLGDDTDFLEAIKAAAAGGKSRKSSGGNNNHPKGGPQLDSGASSRLLLFLQRAGPVCETLLEENLSQVRRGGRSDETDNLSRAAKDGDTTVFHKDSSWVRVMACGKQRGEGKEADGDDGLSEDARAAASGWARLLGDRPILEVHSHAHQPHLLMTVHGPKTDLPAASSKAAKAGSKKGMVGRSEAVAMRTVIALWDAALLSLGRSSGPSKLLCGDGVSSCTCFGPGMASVVVTATETGALHLWDLREPREQHLSTWCLERGLTMGLRAPTYSTLGGGGLGHVSRVVTITPLTSLAEGEQPDLGQGTSSFQLASLDDRGVLTLWMVNEVPRENVRVGSGGGASVQEDAGLSLGGRLRLVRSRSLDVLGNHSLLPGRSRGASFRAGGGVLREVNWEVNLCDVEDELQPGPGAVALAFFPRDPNRFLVGLSSGVVWHCSRFGQAKAPSSFVRGGNSSLLPPCPASALHFNPSLPDHFLVGYEDGLFCLFTASYSEPLRRWDASALTPQLPSSKQLTWALSQEVTWLSWSPHRPSVFWVLLGRRGLLLAFDLLINDQAPIIIESLSKEDGTGEEDGQGRLCVLSLSCEKAGHMAAGSTPTLAMASSKGARFRLLRRGLYDPQPDELASLKTYLDSVL